MKVEVTYQSGYNGCTVTVDGADEFTTDVALKVKIEAVQDAIINEAYKDVIKRGRHEGEFNGDIDELEEFATKAVKDQFGADVEVTFEEDSTSS